MKAKLFIFSLLVFSFSTYGQQLFHVELSPTTRASDTLCAGGLITQQILTVNIVSDVVDEMVLFSSFYVSARGTGASTTCLNNIQMSIASTASGVLPTVLLAKNFYLQPSASQIDIFSLDVTGCPGTYFSLSLDSVEGMGIFSKIHYTWVNPTLSNPMGIVNCFPSGIKKPHSENERCIYPNPFTDHIVIVTENEKDFVILDNTGRQVYAGTASKNTELKTNSWASGMYIVLFSDRSVHKILKQ